MRELKMEMCLTPLVALVEGNDEIDGSDNADVLIGGKGTDFLRGGAGKDTYIFNKGDGVERIIDSDTGADASVLVFGAGIDPNTVKLGLGSLLLDLGDGDAVHINSFNTTDPLASPFFESFQFADGVNLRWDELLERGFDIEADAGGGNLYGTGGPNLIGMLTFRRQGNNRSSFSPAARYPAANTEWRLAA